MKIIICYEIDMHAKYGHPVATCLQVAGHVNVWQSTVIFVRHRTDHVEMA